MLRSKFSTVDGSSLFSHSVVTRSAVAGLAVAASLSLLSACGKSSKNSSETPNPDRELASVLSKFSTPEKLEIDAKIAKAKAEGKVVFVKVSAAWCPPCQALSKLLEGVEQNPNSNPELAATLQKYEIVVLEERFFLNGNITDFLPFQIQFYPSILLIDPATNRSSLTLVEDNAAQLNDVLSAFAQKKSVIEHDLEQIQKTIQTGESQLFTVEGLLSSLPIAIALEQDKATADKTFADLSELLTKNKEALGKLDISEESLAALLCDASISYQRVLVSNGKTTLEQAQKDLAEKATALRSSVDNYYQVSALAFSSPLAQLARSKGLPAAATECFNLSKNRAEKFAVIPKPVPAELSADEAKAIQKANEDLVKEEQDASQSEERVCWTLAARTQQKSPVEVTAFVNAQVEKDAKVVGTEAGHGLARILALSGNFARASEIEAQYLETSEAAKKKSLENYDAATEKLKAQLDEAQKASEAEKVKKLEAAIKGQLDYRVGKALVLESFPAAIGKLVESYKAKSVSPALQK